MDSCNRYRMSLSQVPYPIFSSHFWLGIGITIVQDAKFRKYQQIKSDKGISTSLSYLSHMMSAYFFLDYMHAIMWNEPTTRTTSIVSPNTLTCTKSGQGATG